MEDPIRVLLVDFSVISEITLRLKEMYFSVTVADCEGVALRILNSSNVVDIIVIDLDR